jgi:dethiobiotin synthetase
MRGLFVTGTDTGVGKSVVAAAVCAALAARGARVAAFKPAVTGLEDPPPGWPPDHELLAAAASTGQAPEDVAPYRFGPAVSPHLAASLAGGRVDRTRLLAAARAAAGHSDLLVAEGVGGLLVPLSLDYSVRDLAADLGLPVVVAARPGLGTISHTLLTIEAARAGGLTVAGVVLTPWPGAPGGLERTNRETIERLSGVRVACLARASPASLAAAGAALPLDAWLEARAGSATGQAPRRVA